MVRDKTLTSELKVYHSDEIIKLLNETKEKMERCYECADVRLKEDDTHKPMWLSPYSACVCDVLQEVKECKDVAVASFPYVASDPALITKLKRICEGENNNRTKDMPGIKIKIFHVVTENGFIATANNPQYCNPTLPENDGRSWFAKETIQAAQLVADHLNALLDDAIYAAPATDSNLDHKKKYVVVSSKAFQLVKQTISKML